MTPTSMRRPALTVSALFVAATTGCFTGTEAKGLPCEQHLDCGLRLRCEDGVCGGPQGDEGSTSASTTSATSETGDSGGLAVCGDGIVEDPDELCEPPMAGLNSADCDRDCSLPQCGDGLENPLAETCDASQVSGPVDAETCDADCTAVECGDGHDNPIAEPCDDGDADDYDGCTAQCFVPFFADPMTTQTGSWSVESPEYSAADDSGPIDYSLPERTNGKAGDPTGWQHTGNRWWSGPVPYVGLVTGAEGAPGATRLISTPFVLATDLDGDGSDEDDAATLAAVRFELHFHHAYEFEECGDAPGNGDGGVVRVIDVESGEITTLAPVVGYRGSTTTGAACLDYPRAPNPLVLENPPTPYMPEPAFTGGTAQTEDVVVDLDAYRGREIQLVFEMGFDCFHCNPDDGAGWSIDHVLVAAFPI